MERALIIGTSGGIGAALGAALVDQGPGVTGVSRRAPGLDVTDEARIQWALARLEPPCQRMIFATEAPEIAGRRPEKSLRGLDPAAMAAQCALNAIGPVLVVKPALRLVPRDAPARIGILPARVGSIGANRLRAGMPAAPPRPR